MSVREHNLEIISNHLRACYDKRVTTEESLKHMPAAQRVAVLKQETFKRNIRDRFTIKELAEDIPELTYHNIRYALVGAYDIEYRNKKQPQGLAEYGIVVRHYAGKRQPTFSYDPELMYRALVGDVSSITDMSEVANEKTEPAAPAESVKEEVKEEPKIKYAKIENWLANAVRNAINVGNLRAGEDNIVYVGDSPLYGVFYASIAWMEANGFPVDVTKDAIEYDTTHAISESASTE